MLAINYNDLRRAAANPNSPKPNRAMLEGSVTANAICPFKSVEREALRASPI